MSELVGCTTEETKDVDKQAVTDFISALLSKQYTVDQLNIESLLLELIESLSSAIKSNDELRLWWVCMFELSPLL